jgi:HPt (histidine-containing phosphotransfer) domain-containing protein
MKRYPQPVFDDAAFEKRCLGERELILEILSGSLPALSIHMENLRSCFELGDYAELERSAHSLKGSSGTLSALRLYSTVSELELKAREAVSGEGKDKIEPALLVDLSRLTEQAEKEYSIFLGALREKYPAVFE